MFSKFVKYPISWSLQADLYPWRLIRSMRSGTIVLGYHGIAPDEEIHDPWVQRVQTPVSDFEVHLEFIGKHFEVVSADETLESATGKRRVHLSFDDGYVGFADHAVPLLNKYGFTASVYVVTGATTGGWRLPPYIGRVVLGNCEPGLISFDSIKARFEISDRESRTAAYSRVSTALKTGSPVTVSSLVEELVALIPADHLSELNSRFGTDELMDWGTVKAVHDAGFTVGAHSETHLSLSEAQSRDDIDKETRGSVAAVRHHLGSCHWFAYPNGTPEDRSSAAALALKHEGVRGAWTLEPGVIRQPGSIDPFRLPRISVPKSFDRFKLMMNTALVRT